MSYLTSLSNVGGFSSQIPSHFVPKTTTTTTTSSSTTTTVASAIKKQQEDKTTAAAAGTSLVVKAFVRPVDFKAVGAHFDLRTAQDVLQKQGVPSDLASSTLMNEEDDESQTTSAKTLVEQQQLLHTSLDDLGSLRQSTLCRLEEKSTGVEEKGAKNGNATTTTTTTAVSEAAPKVSADFFYSHPAWARNSFVSLRIDVTKEASEKVGDVVLRALSSWNELLIPSADLYFCSLEGIPLPMRVANQSDGDGGESNGSNCCAVGACPVPSATSNLLVECLFGAGGTDLPEPLDPRRTISSYASAFPCFPPCFVLVTRPSFFEPKPVVAAALNSVAMHALIVSSTLLQREAAKHKKVAYAEREQRREAQLGAITEKQRWWDSTVGSPARERAAADTRRGRKKTA